MKKSIQVVILTFIFISFLTSCAMPASGQKFDVSQTNNTQSQLYIYRPSQFTDKGIKYEVSVDGHSTGILRDGGYLVTNLSPGQHTVAVELQYRSTPPLEKVINVSNSGKTFLKVATGASLTGKDLATNAIAVGTLSTIGVGVTSMSYDANLTTVSSATAIQELSSLRQSS